MKKNNKVKIITKVNLDDFSEEEKDLHQKLSQELHVFICKYVDNNNIKADKLLSILVSAVTLCLAKLIGSFFVAHKVSKTDLNNTIQAINSLFKDLCFESYNDCNKAKERMLKEASEKNDKNMVKNALNDLKKTIDNILND